MCKEPSIMNSIKKEVDELAENVNRLHKSYDVNRLIDRIINVALLEIKDKLVHLNKILKSSKFKDVYLTWEDISEKSKFKDVTPTIFLLNNQRVYGLAIKNKFYKLHINVLDLLHEESMTMDEINNKIKKRLSCKDFCDSFIIHKLELHCKDENVAENLEGFIVIYIDSSQFDQLRSLPYFRTKKPTVDKESKKEECKDTKETIGNKMDLIMDHIADCSYEIQKGEISAFYDNLEYIISDRGLKNIYAGDSLDFKRYEEELKESKINVYILHKHKNSSDDQDKYYFVTTLWESKFNISSEFTKLYSKLSKTLNFQKVLNEFAVKNGFSELEIGYPSGEYKTDYRFTLKKQIDKEDFDLYKIELQVVNTVELSKTGYTEFKLKDLER